MTEVSPTLPACPRGHGFALMGFYHDVYRCRDCGWEITRRDWIMYLNGRA